MRYLIALILLFVVAVTVYGQEWMNNPYTRKPDYWSGVSPIPQPYQASPTATSLRDLLITVGIMSAAPSVSEDDGVFQNRDNGIFQGRDNAVFQDRFN